MVREAKGLSHRMKAVLPLSQESHHWHELKEELILFVSGTRNLAFWIFVFLIGAHTAIAHAKDKPVIRIDKDTVIVVPSTAPEPIQRSVQDLVRDMTEVFGAAPQVVHQSQSARTEIVIDSDGTMSPLARKGKPESFSLRALVRDQGAGAQIVLSGADMRGTIYAIYTFSEKVLGVDPMYYWTDNLPKRQEVIDLPANFAYSDPGPLFRFRGFFINDEDLLTGWAPGKKEDHSGISLEVWDHIFETILRLKGNMVVPGTWIFPDDGQVKLVGERGLWLSQHHATPLGVNVARWPAGVPYNYSDHPEIIERAWRNAVNTYAPNQEILWEVGLRGLSDVSYAALDPSVRNNNALLGKRISDAIADQERIVSEHHPGAVFVTDLWSEGNKLMREGVLKIPKGTITVWSDTGYGKLQDAGQARAGQGAYFHVAMLNDRANQLTEMVPVERLLGETGRLSDAGATQFYLLNTSDLRPVVMSARAMMEAAWGSLKAGQAHKYYRSWARVEFGDAAADDIADVYERYFQAPAHQGEGREYGDQYYHTTARRMLLNSEVDWPTYVIPNQSPKWQGTGLQGVKDRKAWLSDAIAREKQACGDSLARWKAVDVRALKAAALVEPSRKNFYQSSVLTMIEINMDSDEMLLDVAKAIEAKEAGDTQQAIGEVRQAEAALDRVKASEAKAEYGKWRNWYHGDWFTSVDRTREALMQYEKFLVDPSTPVAAPIRWADWEGYYHILHYEGDRTVDVH